MTQFLRLAASGSALGLRMIMRPLLSGSSGSEASHRKLDAQSAEAARDLHAHASQLDRLEL